MLKLSLNELWLIAEGRGIKGYKRMVEDRLLSAFNVSESVKETEAHETVKEQLCLIQQKYINLLEK